MNGFRQQWNCMDVSGVKQSCLSSYMMNALDQYYYCFKGKSAEIHIDDVICQQNELYIWQDDIFNILPLV